jgi:UDP:flavonoid glycosyltransferase YjiC (YdhE family)
MRDLVNDFRTETLGLPALHTRQATFMMIDERVPYTYCWSPSLVPKPNDWASHINVSGFFFLEHDATANDNHPDELINFLGLNNKQGDQSLSPPIYIGFGSITGHDSNQILQIVLEALEKTGYRALLCGLAKDNDKLPENILKIENISHDWLFQHGEFNMQIWNIFSIVFLFSISCMSSWWCRYNCCWSSCW